MYLIIVAMSSFYFVGYREYRNYRYIDCSGSTMFLEGKPPELGKYSVLYLNRATILPVPVDDNSLCMIPSS